MLPTEFFDVPLQPLMEGLVTGRRLAAECIAALQRAQDSNECRALEGELEHVLEAAYAILESERKCSFNEPAKKGAAQGFVRSMLKVVLVSARHLNLSRAFDSMIDQAKRDAAAVDGLVSKRRAETIRRLEVGRAAAARARRVEAHTAGSAHLFT